jgi:hydrogenase expression/formation protein HypE
VARTCALLGFEPLHLANEGRFLAVLPPERAEAALALLAPHGGCWIGTVQAATAAPRVLLRTELGTERLLIPQSGELLPRIC